MEKISCAIVKDLIPSYLDKICSEESGKAVEEHLLKCKDCRAHMETLKNTELFAEKPDLDGLDYMKKVKRYYARKNALGAALLLGMSIIILPIIAKLHPSSENNLYYIFFAILAFGTSFLLSNYKAEAKNRWPGIIAASVGVLGAIAATYLTFILYRCTQTETGLLGTELHESGPVFNALYITIVILELLVFAGCAADSAVKQYAFGILPSLNLTCCSLCMSYRSILFHMDSQETLLRAIFLELKTFALMSAGILLAEFAVRKIYNYIRQRAWEKV